MLFRSKPGYKEKLKPSKRRNWVSRHLPLSTRPVMKYRKDVAWEPVFEPEKIKDDMDAQLVRLGAGMTSAAPDPTKAGGYYVFVANGSIEHAGSELPLWSLVFVDPSEAGYQIKAGQHGLEALVLQFPTDDD